jgi:integrase
MDNIQIRFTFSAPGRKGKLTICAYTCPKDRTYRNLSKITLDDSLWDSYEQRFQFKGKSRYSYDEIKAANDTLDLICECHRSYLDFSFDTPADLLDVLLGKKDIDEFTNKGLTLLAYLDAYIAKLHKSPTSNYVSFEALRNKLDGVIKKSNGRKGGSTVTYTDNVPRLANGKRLADVPIADVDNKVLSTYADWVQTKDNNSNYKVSNRVLKQIVTHAQESGYNNNTITFSYQKNTIKTVNNNEPKKKVLSEAQIKQIENLTADMFPIHSAQSKIDTTELLLDAVLLLFYTLSRPADVINFRREQISYKENSDGKLTPVLTYVPFKKRSHSNARIVELPISDKAWAIMEKYKGQSKCGYILPFSCNCIYQLKSEPVY